MDRWCGRVAIVTGASAGIGAALALQLAQNGMRVVGVARRSDRIKSLAGELKGCKGELHAVEGDVTKEEDVLRVVKWTRDNLGGADVLVNNAGIYRSAQVSEVKTDVLRALYEVNVFGLCMFTREVIKDMRDRKVDDGHIFHIGSFAGQSIVPYPGCIPYSGTKHAIRVMTEGLRRELRDLNTKIRVTEISPGIVRTDVFEAAGLMTAEQAQEMFNKGPVLECEDVVNALVYALWAPPHVQIHEIVMHSTGADE